MSAPPPGETLVVIQPTSYCNISCRYCYLPSRDERYRLTDSTLTAIALELASSPHVSESLTVLWHNGEPLTVPVQHYERWHRLLRSRLESAGRQVKFAFQTNGTTINERWADFLRFEEASVCISIDGPREFHDLYRRSRQDKGTFERVLAGIETLRAGGVARLTALGVLNRKSLTEPDAMFEFYKGLGVAEVGFNIAEISGVNLTSGLHASERELVTSFYRQFLRRLAKEHHPFRVRELRQAISAFVSSAYPSASMRSFTNEPYKIWTFSSAGDFWTFCPDLAWETSPEHSDYVLGNVHEISLLEATSTLSFARLAGDVRAGVERCRHECAYWGFCGGGVPSNKAAEHGTVDATETTHCVLAIQAVADAVIGHTADGLAHHGFVPKVECGQAPP